MNKPLCLRDRPRLRKMVDRQRNPVGYSFYCPGCKMHHVVYTAQVPQGPPPSEFNGDLDYPTFRPAILVESTRDKKRCHCLVTNGTLRFLPDSQHDLAGVVIEMEVVHE